MPLRDDLLKPIPGEKPSGPDLYFDPLFDQIKEARREEDDTVPAGDWARAIKKADHRLVIKLAGDALATRSKDLRLAGWLIESLFKREGLEVLAPSLEMLRGLQETFWPTLHPEIEDGDLEMRSLAVERLSRQLILLLDQTPITTGGLSAAKFKESRTVGYESDAVSDDRQRARQQAIQDGKITAEEFDKEYEATPKSFYVGVIAALDAAEKATSQLDTFQREVYGQFYPNMAPLETGLQSLRQIVMGLLNERLKTDPDPVATDPASVAQIDTVQITDAVTKALEAGVAAGLTATAKNAIGDAYSGLKSLISAKHGAVSDPIRGWDGTEARPIEPAPETVPALSGACEAYAVIVRGAQFLHQEDVQSPVPYLVCAALRLGEMRMQGPEPAAGFAEGPSSALRSTLKGLANSGAWADLLTSALPVLGEPCARAWLDLHRYIWRAAQETGADATANAVIATVRSLLLERPEVRHWMLEDDTPAANPETQGWLDAEVLPKEAERNAAVEHYEPPPPPAPPPVVEDDAAAEDPYDKAMQMFRGGRSGDAIAMMVREVEVQSSGRMRFRRRLQVAEMCMAAGHSEVARAVLEDLAQEIDRRHLETWESSELLAAPLSLLLKCMEGRSDVNGAREALFARLCLLDPKAALSAHG